MNQIKSIHIRLICRFYCFESFEVLVDVAVLMLNYFCMLDEGYVDIRGKINHDL